MYIHSISAVSCEGQFSPDVIQDLAAEVDRLGNQLKEYQRKRSTSRPSSRSSSRSSVFKEEIDHLKKELDDTRHEGIYLSHTVCLLCLTKSDVADWSACSNSHLLIGLHALYAISIKL